jgi:DNA-directed RNA polymerase specialized sigma24 family protein
MREIEEMSYRDIAEAASAPIGTVMSGYRVRDKACRIVWRRG